MGDGIKLDKVKAKEFLKKACDGGVMASCAYLGDMYTKGDGVKQDKVKAKEFLEKVSDMTE